MCLYTHLYYFSHMFESIGKPASETNTEKHLRHMIILSKHCRSTNGTHLSKKKAKKICLNINHNEREMFLDKYHVITSNYLLPSYTLFSMVVYMYLIWFHQHFLNCIAKDIPRVPWKDTDINPKKQIKVTVNADEIIVMI
jgi:hypothetical protein